MDPSATASASAGDVLIVDDTLASLKLLSDLLGGAGYSVREAPNGELALWTAASRAPDVILLDIRMPGIDGYEVCRRLKADTRTAHVPVIFLSALDDTDDKVAGFNAGAVDYVNKPFAEREVLARVHTQVSLARLAAELEAERQSLERKVEQRTRTIAQAMEQLAREVEVRKSAEKRLRLACKAFEVSFDSIFVTDTEGTIAAVNPAFCEVVGYTADEIVGANVRVLNSGRHERAFFAELWDAILQRGRWSGEIWNRRKDGSVFPCLHTISASRDARGRITHFVGVFTDVSQRRDAERMLNFLTRHDPLTGLPNRLLMNEIFVRLQDDAGEAEDSIAVLCLDIDRFRAVNDMVGHAAGDAMLQAVAQRLTECVGDAGAVFRQGADEFIILAADSKGLQQSATLLQAIFAAMARELTFNEQALAISVSVGISVYPQDGTTLPELINQAGAALQEAKGQGGGSHVFFRPQMQALTRGRFDIEMRLRQALKNQEFELFYQPQVSLHSGAIVSAEALIRWGSAACGYVSPASFIPVAEETGSIVQIGEWVLHSVCRQLRRWRDDGITMKVAVNLSALQFRQANLCELIQSVLQQHGLDAACLELEITESSLIQNVAGAIATMRQLKAIGASLSLDDFGTGYSSLSYLKKFPIDYLKIDQSFVQDIGSDPDAAAIVLSILSLAHNLRLKVVAEGVETAAQLAYLRAHGCDLMQGYYFCHPLPVSEFEARVKQGDRLQ